MIEYFKEHPIRMLVIFLVLLFAGNWAMERRADRQRQLMAEGEDAPGGRGPSNAKASDRIQEARNLQYKDPQQALAQLEAILAQPKSPDETAQARELAPTVLNLAFHKSLKAKEHAAAKALLDRLQKEYPDHFQTRSTQDSWGRDLGERCRQAIKAGQEAQMNRLLKEILEGAHEKVNSHVFGELIEYLTGKATAAHAAGKDAEAAQYLEQAARFLTAAGFGSPMARLLRQSKWDGGQLHALAEKWFAAGKAPLAIPLYHAAYGALNDGAWQGRPEDYQERQKLQAAIETRLHEAYLKAGDELVAGQSTLVCTLPPQQVYREAINVSRQPEKRLEAMRKIMVVEEREFGELAAPVLAHSLATMATKQGLEYEAVNQIYSQAHEAQRAFNDLAQRTGGMVWQESRRLPGFDPWVQADPAVKAQVWREFPAANQEEQRRQSLERIYRDASWPLPVEGIQDAEEKMCEVYARWGLLSCHSSRPEGLRMIRLALAHTRHPPLRDRLAEQCQEFIRQNRKKKDFEGLYEFTVFYTGEFVEIRKDDPFRQELFGCLTEASKHFADRSAMKRIFVLSLLNEIYPETAEGRNALSEAIKLSFAAAAAQPDDTNGAPVVGRCPLEGHAALAVDNDTEYHIMCFYEGAETFFVRIPPHRRGSLAMRNGAYKVAVISTSDSIRPYRGNFTANGEQRKSAYVIRKSNERADAARGFGGAAYGDYRLLRGPAGMENLKVDPRSGLILR